MSNEFASMLKDTFTKMQDKIESANANWENENDGAMLKHFDDYTNKNPGN